MRLCNIIIIIALMYLNKDITKFILYVQHEKLKKKQIITNSVSLAR